MDEIIEERLDQKLWMLTVEETLDDEELDDDDGFEM